MLPKLCVIQHISFALMCIGDVAQVESMIKHGADINEGGDFDYTPLHISAGAGKL